MILTCIASTDFLTTVASVKTLLGVTGTSDDTLLATLVSRATDAVEAYVGRPLRLQVYSESVPAYGTRYLMLSRTPIRVVLRAFDSTDTGSATAFCSTDYRIEDDKAGLISRDAGFAWTAPTGTEFVDFRRPGQEEQDWLFEYAAGYRPIESTTTCWGITSTAADLPGDMAMAAEETVKGWYLTRQADPSVQSVTVGSLSMTFKSGGAVTSMGSLPESATKLLARYRRLA